MKSPQWPSSGLSTHDSRPPITYDILPASESGAYFASGVLIGSTLASFSDVFEPALAAERAV
jgi:hypothetical protein